MEWSILVTISLFVLSHLGMTIYWASRITTLLTVMREKLKDIVDELKDFRVIYSTKEEMMLAKQMVDRDIASLYKQIEELRTRRA